MKLKVNRRRKYHPRDSAVTSRMMSAVRAKNSKAEMLLRKALWSRGLRYRLHSSKLVGRPDLVFGSAKVVIFVDGDYWHGRALTEGGPKALREVVRGQRFDWWLTKLSRNIERDRQVTEDLTAAGWKVMRFWESDVLASPERIASQIASAVRTRRDRS